MPKKVLVLGGGTGTYTTLIGLKKFDLDLSVVVTMMDSGGSNRIIRDEFGLLPTSDIRQAILALSGSKSSEVLRKLFTYRYDHGTGITGMTFGNLFMAALTEIEGSQKAAIATTCKILEVEGQILPVTFDNTNLIARYQNGRQVLGEHYIDEPDPQVGKSRIAELSVFPSAKASKEALEAISMADLIVFAPGDLYTSLICNLVIDGISDAIAKSKAKKVFVVNLMTKFGQTESFTASDHLFEVQKYLKGGIIDFVLINSNTNISKTIIKKYSEENAHIVADDFDHSNPVPKPVILRTDLLSSDVYTKPKSDKLARSLIRHDPDKLAKAIVSLL